MTKLAPARMISTLMAVWFLASSAAQWLAGRIAQLTAAETVGGQVLDPAKALATYSHTFLMIGCWGAAAGVVLLIAQPVAQAAGRTASTRCIRSRRSTATASPPTRSPRA